MPGVLAGAESLAVTTDGHVIVADRLAGRLQRFTGKGELIDVWATEGTAAGQLSEPTAVAVLPDGDVLVVDAGTARISRFSATGAYEQAVDLSRRCPPADGCELSAVAAGANSIYARSTAPSGFCA